MKEIQISGGHIVIVDDEDAPILLSRTWWTSEKGYVVSDIKAKRVRLHRMILGLTKEDSCVVDHKDGNKLNNQKENLRTCTQAENVRNSKRPSNNKTGLKGVSAFRGKFRAAIVVNRKQRHIGVFSDPMEAHLAYRAAADELHGKFANYG